MHEDRLRFLVGRFNEVENLLRKGLRLLALWRIKKDLVFLVKPVEFKVDYSDGLPMIGDLSPRTINYVCYFISHHKF